ncbi:MAG: PAS domain-containing protein, partial [Desulfomonilaceae bacterium]
MDKYSAAQDNNADSRYGAIYDPEAGVLNSPIKDRFGMLLASAGQMYFEVDREFTVTYSNDLLKEVFGDPGGKKCYEFICKKSHVCPDCPMDKVLRGADRAVIEEVRYDKDGVPIWLENTSTPIKNDAGEIIGAGELSVDVTQRKR